MAINILKLSNNYQNLRILAEYTNGGAEVILYEDGTKIRKINNPIYNFPESIDLKITNYCDLGCKFCYESSNKEGTHCNVNSLLNCLSELPKGIEIAIGGGNPFSHPELETIIAKLNEKKFIVNITINMKHINQNLELIEKLIKSKQIYGLGISIPPTFDFCRIEYFNDLKQLNNCYSYKESNNIVYHYILGINQPEQLHLFESLNKFKNHQTKFLILGYKNYGRGNSLDYKYYFKNQETLIEIFNEFRNRSIFSFDNLAIKQLELKKIFPNEFNNFFLGEDFTTSMYVDAVSKKFAPNSTPSNSSIDYWKNISLLDFFKQGQKQ